MIVNAAKNTIVDLLVIGGGIHGVGVAVDASGRGLSVLLCEQGDLASATSSASSKLIHGGLRYLEQGNIALVHESLTERALLLNNAPHLVKPQRFVVPYPLENHHKRFRPAWQIQLGLTLYDLLACLTPPRLPMHRKIIFNKQEYALQMNYPFGYAYSDCVTDDARLVVHNALLAKQLGATINVHTQCLGGKRVPDYWEIQLQQTQSHITETIYAKAIINTTGAWAETVQTSLFGIKTDTHLRLVKGSHLVVKSFYTEKNAYLLPHIDGRVIFVVPYHEHFTMIGTTDIDTLELKHDYKINAQEIHYLLDTVNSYFSHTLTEKDIMSSWSGVRALVKDNAILAASTSRESKTTINLSPEKQLPFITVFGGKLTTYRSVCEKAVNQLQPYFKKLGKPFTRHQKLPGAPLHFTDYQDYIISFTKKYHFLPLSVQNRYLTYYGTLAEKILEGKSSLADMGEDFGHGLYQAEISYLIKDEWATTAQDILWRRTKLGLLFNKQETEHLTANLTG